MAGSAISEEGADWDALTVKDVESDIMLLGASGIEDLLQDDVKRTIQDFRKAGIKVWMLTGDKGLTAKQIGISCGIIGASDGNMAALKDSFSMK